MVPKLFTQSVSCPLCSYPNDASFRFCQSCGYQRKVLVDVPASGSSLPLDVITLDDRLSQIARFSASSSYAKQKSSLQKELELFCLPFLFRRMSLPPLPVSFVASSFGKIARERLRSTNLRANFSDGKGRFRALVQCASPMGQWTP